MIKFLKHPDFSKIYLPDVVEITYYPEARTIYFDTPRATYGISRYYWNFKNLRYDQLNPDYRRDINEIDVIEKNTWHELLRVLRKDRIKGFIVTLDKDYREDDVQVIRQAIEMIKGVLSVDEVIADSDDHMNRQRIAMEFKKKIFDVLNDI
jgi:hypothetical protein